MPEAPGLADRRAALPLWLVLLHAARPAAAFAVSPRRLARASPLLPLFVPPQIGVPPCMLANSSKLPRWFRLTVRCWSKVRPTFPAGARAVLGGLEMPARPLAASMKKFQPQPADQGLDPTELVKVVRPVLEEILVSEVALRVWTAVLYAYDRRRQTHDAEPIARSVLLGHLEVRARALALLIHSPCLPAEDAVRLNRLRRRAEALDRRPAGHLRSGLRRRGAGVRARAMPGVCRRPAARSGDAEPSLAADAGLAAGGLRPWSVGTHSERRQQPRDCRQHAGLFSGRFVRRDRFAPLAVVGAAAARGQRRAGPGSTRWPADDELAGQESTGGRMSMLFSQARRRF